MSSNLLFQLRAGRLAGAAPARILACGAWLKNRACLIEGPRIWWSTLHGDLGDPRACEALDVSLAALVGQASGPIAAVAHDLHPDFHSTRVAIQLAEALGVPAIGVQHHHAHIAVALAEHGVLGSVIGLALDGVGLGIDGTAWGGEVLTCGAGMAAHEWSRVAHLPALRLPGGDVAAREPWRMAAAALHASGLGAQIVPRLGPVVGESTAGLLNQMLDRRINCPQTTSAGRWFDAVAGLLGLSVRDSHEAEAAIALERAATAWVSRHGDVHDGPGHGDLLALVPQLLSLLPMAPDANAQAGAANGRSPTLAQALSPTWRAAQELGAALFHHVLVDHLIAQVKAAALAMPASAGPPTIVLGGGCFYNALLRRWLTERLTRLGHVVVCPTSVSCGDADLALGQAWVAACTVSRDVARPVNLTWRGSVMAASSAMHSPFAIAATSATTKTTPTNFSTVRMTPCV